MALVNVASVRTDVLDLRPVELNSEDNLKASDHLPVQMAFRNPFVQSFRITSIQRSNDNVTLNWESVPGQRYAVKTALEPPTTVSGRLEIQGD